MLGPGEIDAGVPGRFLVVYAIVATGRVMSRITFVEHDGTVHEVDVESGSSLMKAAIDNLVPGIDADCGGECSCATCHVVLTNDWFERLGSPADREEEMLDMNPERQRTSRLACQIPVSEELEGIEVQLPEFQF